MAGVVKTSVDRDGYKAVLALLTEGAEALRDWYAHNAAIRCSAACNEGVEAAAMLRCSLTVPGALVKDERAGTKPAAVGADWALWCSGDDTGGGPADEAAVAAVEDEKELELPLLSLPPSSSAP